MSGISEQLRQAVLQAAIQGKLTKQLEEDGDATELFQKIMLTHKKSKSVQTELNLQAMDFEIPADWIFVELNDVFQFVDYRGMTPIKSSQGIFLVTASNIRQGFMEYSRKEYVSEEIYNMRLSRGVTEEGDLLFTTEAPMGYAAICNLKKCTCGQRVITFKQYLVNTVIPKLYMFFILSPAFQMQLNDNCTGTTAKGIKAEKLKHFLIPLPPLSEQHRIVARVDELMAKIDELEKIDKELTVLHKAFPGDMKAALLQAAMQGRLTEQLDEDGNAGELFEQIKAEKEQLIKENKIKKEKELELISEDDIPFDIPENWEWVRLKDLVYIYGGLSYNKGNLTITSDDMVTVFRGGNISEMTYSFKADDVKISREFIKNESLYLRKNQLITPAVTSLQHLGKIARIDENYSNVVAGGFVLNIVPYINSDIFSTFFLYCFSRQDMKKRCADIANKSGQAFYNLSREKLLDSWFPLPPLTEQHRIVKKLDQLLPLCESLEEKL